MRVWSYSNTPLSSSWQIYFTPGLSVVAFHTLKAASQAKQQHRHPCSDWQFYSQESRQHCSISWKKHRGFQAHTVNHLYLKLRYVFSVSAHCTEIRAHVLHGGQNYPVHVIGTASALSEAQHIESYPSRDKKSWQKHTQHWNGGNRSSIAL